MKRNKRLVFRAKIREAKVILSCLGKGKEAGLDWEVGHRQFISRLIVQQGRCHRGHTWGAWSGKIWNWKVMRGGWRR